MPNPTEKTYGDLNVAYDFFNNILFDGRLPRCLITMQRRVGAYGYFAGDRFGTRDGHEKTDEIALNPAHLKERTTQETLSTLVHEMTHLEQHHFGQPSRNGYHNKQWAELMKRVGLFPSDTAQPGGKETGQRVSHYIVPGGPFDIACAELLNEGVSLDYVEMWSETDEGKKARKTKAASKTKYTCPACSLNAWAKPDVLLVCGECQEELQAED
jgi:SprT-like family